MPDEEKLPDFEKMSLHELDRKLAKMKRQSRKTFWITNGLIALVLVLMAWRWEAHIYPLQLGLKKFGKPAA